MFKSLLTLSGLAASGVALAHPGHDHGSWTAPLLHALWLAPIAIAVVATFFYIRKKITK